MTSGAFPAARAARRGAFRIAPLRAAGVVVVALVAHASEKQNFSRTLRRVGVSARSRFTPEQHDLAHGFRPCPAPAESNRRASHEK